MNRLLRDVLPLLGMEAGFAAAHLQIAPGRFLPGRLPTDELAVGSVAAVGLAAESLLNTGRIDVDPAQVRVAMLGEQVQTIDGARSERFDPWSGFFPTAEGWLRTHANYPHHKAALATVLGLDPQAGRQALAAALCSRTAQQVEAEVTAAGGVAVRVRQQADWAAAQLGRAATGARLVNVRAVGRAGPRAVGRPRVLDLTRVIAGPVATRTLAYLGCDVLRVDDPNLPELPHVHVDTGAAKRTTLLDLRRPSELARLHGLLAGADVLVTGYRPGALAPFGLDADTVAARYPSVVHAALSAWGPAGPWATRRGFDSVVQAATGIAWAESADGREPGALPAAALDHATGYLLAAGVLTALWRREFEGRTWRVDAHLAATAGWLLRHGAGPLETDPPPPAEPYLIAADTAYGRVVQSRPAFTLPGLTEFPFPPRLWGADEPRWES
ncbi:MAG: CoA transferase [Dermatophilaceae bacterium]